MIQLSESLPYQLLADLVLALHVGVVAFVVGGLLFIVLGNFLTWRSANARWFRFSHLAAIAVVVTEAWLGIVCPLTSAEMWLRTQAHSSTYNGSFIQHWLERLLYYQAPGWVFTAGYSIFAGLVAATWWYFPPRPSGRNAATRRRGAIPPTPPSATKRHDEKQ